MVNINKMSFDEVMKQLKDVFKDYDSTIIDLQKELEKERKKDIKKEIRKKDEEIEEMRKNSLMILTKKEKKAIDDFRTKHYEQCKNSGKYHYTISGTGLGNCISIKCPYCYEEIDVTDVSKF